MRAEPLSTDTHRQTLSKSSLQKLGKLAHYSRPLTIYLTNRIHVTVRLFSNRSQMTSKWGKNNKVAHEPLVDSVTVVLATF